MDRPSISSMGSQYSSSISPSPRLEAEPTQTSQIEPDRKQRTEGFEGQGVELPHMDFVNTHPLRCDFLHKPSMIDQLDGRDWSADASNHQAGASVVPDFNYQSTFVTSEYDLALQPSNQWSSSCIGPAPATLTNNSLGCLSYDTIGARNPTSQLATPTNPHYSQAYLTADGRNMPALNGHGDDSSVTGSSNGYCASTLQHRVI